MKKISLFAATAFLAVTALSSCNNCITCDYADDAITDTELCDASQAEEDVFIAAAEAAATLAGTTVTCE